MAGAVKFFAGPGSVMRHPRRATKPVAQRLKTIRQPRLLDDRISRVPGQNLAIHREIFLRTRAIPDLVIAFSLAMARTAIIPQNPFNKGCVAAHQTCRRILEARSCIT